MRHCKSFLGFKMAEHVYPLEVSCSMCTTVLVVEEAALEGFVSCPTCGAKPCLICGLFFDEGELLVHMPFCEPWMKCGTREDSKKGARSLWREDEAPSLWEEIEIERLRDGEVSFEACIVLSNNSGLRVEYASAAEEDKVWVHGLDFFRDLSVDERLDAAVGKTFPEAAELKWCRCEATGAIYADTVENRERQWRYLDLRKEDDDDDDRQDNGEVTFNNKKAVLDLASATLLRNGPTARGRAPDKKRRKIRVFLTKTNGKKKYNPKTVRNNQKDAVSHENNSCSSNDDNSCSSDSDREEAALALEAVKNLTSLDPYSAMAALLENLDLPFSERRSVLRKRAKEPPRGVTVGVTNLRREGWAALSQTVQFPEFHVVAQALAAFFRATCPDPEACFTSVQINRGTAGDDAANLHKDRNNRGLSWIVGLGDYERGELWTHNDGIVDIRHNWHRFDGTAFHAALPYRGLRYSLVYWCHTNALTSLKPDQRHLAERLGFAFPDNNNNDDDDIIEPPHGTDSSPQKSREEEQHQRNNNNHRRERLSKKKKKDDKAAARAAFRACLEQHRAGIVPPAWADENA